MERLILITRSYLLENLILHNPRRNTTPPFSLAASKVEQRCATARRLREEVKKYQQPSEDIDYNYLYVVKNLILNNPRRNPPFHSHSLPAAYYTIQAPSSHPRPLTHQSIPTAYLAEAYPPFPTLDRNSEALRLPIISSRISHLHLHHFHSYISRILTQRLNPARPFYRFVGWRGVGLYCRRGRRCGCI